VLLPRPGRPPIHTFLKILSGRGGLGRANSLSIAYDPQQNYIIVVPLLFILIYLIKSVVMRKYVIKLITSFTEVIETGTSDNQIHSADYSW
jgi:hypothetical protein